MNLKIAGLDGQAEGVTVVAQFHPKEVSVDRTVHWNPQADAQSLAYTGAEPKTMSFELMFGGFESGASVQPHIARLHQLSEVDSTLKRPPKVRVVYGVARAAGTIPPLDGVIEAVSVRYLMFSENGVPLRATVSLKIREAGKIKVAIQQP